MVALGGGASRAAAFAFELVEFERAGAIAVSCFVACPCECNQIKKIRSFHTELLHEPTF